MRYFEEHFGNITELVRFANLKLAEGIRLVSFSHGDCGVDGIFLDNRHPWEVKNDNKPSRIMSEHKTIGVYQRTGFLS